jgi:hypothetical protein
MEFLKRLAHKITDTPGFPIVMSDFLACPPYPHSIKSEFDAQPELEA